MASRGDVVVEQMRALKVTASSDAHQDESVDVVDLLPGPIWHIIFRHLLLPSAADSAQPHTQSDSLSASQKGAGSTSCGTTSQRTAREQHEMDARRFGPSWPLLRCAMASKRLLHHVTSFSELEPISLVCNSQEIQWAEMVSWFLRFAAHKSLDLTFSSLQDLQSLNRLTASSAHSITSLCLKFRDLSFGDDPIQCEIINPVFLENFGQLQRLKLGRGRWKLGNLKAAWFTDLRSLSIDHLDCNGYDLAFFSAITPQLHEFSFSAESRQPCHLSFKFSAARIITISCEQQRLNLRFSLPPSLKAFSATAEALGINCECSRPLSLDSLTLVGRTQVDVFSLPLASAKTVLLSGPTILVQSSSPWEDLFASTSQRSLTATQRSVTQLLSSIAPTVEMLTVRHGLPLEQVPAEWSCLRRLAIGANRRRRSGGGRHTAAMDDAEFLSLVRRGFVQGEESGDEACRPFINAPKLQSIFCATREWHLGTLVSLRRHFPSLTFYCIVGRSFRWEGEGERRRNEPVMQVRRDDGDISQDMVQDDQIMSFLLSL